MSASDETRAPAPFIVGVPRSGTTLLRLMLDAHPEMAIPPETYFVTNLLDAAEEGADGRRLADVLTAHRRFGDLGISDADVRGRLAGLDRPAGGDAVRVAFGLYAERRGKPRWGDKTPAYLNSMVEISGALPEARFVHIIRDGRDVALSVLAMPKEDRPMRKPDSIDVVALRWSRRIERARRHARSVPHYLEIRYEDLVTDPEPVLRRVCEFVELDFVAGMLDYHSGAGERLEEMNRDLAARGELPAQRAEGRVAPHTMATRPPDRERIAAWRTGMTREQVVEFERKGADMLRELGYELGGSA